MITCSSLVMQHQSIGLKFQDGTTLVLKMQNLQNLLFIHYSRLSNTLAFSWASLLFNSLSNYSWRYSPILWFLKSYLGLIVLFIWYYAPSYLYQWKNGIWKRGLLQSIKLEKIWSSRRWWLQSYWILVLMFYCWLLWSYWVNTNLMF